MHPEAYRWGEGLLKSLPGIGTVLELGSRNLNGSLKGVTVAKWVGIDRRAGQGVDVIANAVDYYTDERYDCVVCTEVLEHEERWRDIIACAAHHLDYGGYFILTCAGPGRPVHSAVEATLNLAPDEFYGNVYPDDLGEALSTCFKQFVVVENRESCDLYALAVR